MKKNTNTDSPKKKKRLNSIKPDKKKHSDGLRSDSILGPIGPTWCHICFIVAIIIIKHLTSNRVLSQAYILDILLVLSKGCPRQSRCNRNRI